MNTRLFTVIVFVSLMLVGVGSVFAEIDAPSLLTSDFCGQTSWDMLQSCEFSSQAAFRLALAKCDNRPSQAGRNACKEKAQLDLWADAALCGEQFAARQLACIGLGKEPYAPVINPADFVSVIDNPYLPLKPGTTFIYEGMTDEGKERVEFTVTGNTKVILGVTCVAVRDIAKVNGIVVEDTIDWFAQDSTGNVWYFGELSKQFRNGELVGLDGSWIAGVEGAKPGIVMKAVPRVGDVYRQEFALGVAEDMAQVLSLNKSVTVPAGSYSNCLVTKDFSPLEPDALEYKIYAPGVGQVRTMNIKTGEHIDLIQVITR